MFPLIYRSWRYGDFVRAASAYSPSTPVSPVRIIPALGIKTQEALRDMMSQTPSAGPRPRPLSDDQDRYEPHTSEPPENPFPRPSLWVQSVFGREGVASRPEKILIGEDGSQAAQAALKDAEFLAKHYGCQTVRVTMPDEMELIAEGLLQAAMKNGCDMIAVGSPVRSLVDRIHNGSTAERLMQASPVPVWVSRPGPHGSLSDLKKILVPIDDTTHSLKTIAQAVILAHDFGAEFTVLHVREKDRELQAAFDRSRPLLEKIPWTLKAVEEDSGGHSIAETIVAYAHAQDVDLILMGAHREDIHAPLLSHGNAAEVIQCAREAEARPVLALHSF